MVTPNPPKWSIRLCLAVLALSVGLLACSSGSSGPLAPRLPHSIVIVSGNDQEGKANEALAEPFVVRVTDAKGNGVAGVAVSWSVVSGGGALLSETVTDTDGFARVIFTPMFLGLSTVMAWSPATLGSPVTFTVQATVQVVRLFDFNGSVIRIRPADANVPVGTMVEWVCVSVPCSIASLSTPAGGESFATGELGPGGRFQFVPNVTGTWQYEARCLDVIDCNVDTASGTITAESW